MKFYMFSDSLEKCVSRVCKFISERFNQTRCKTECSLINVDVSIVLFITPKMWFLLGYDLLLKA